MMLAAIQAHIAAAGASLRFLRGLLHHGPWIRARWHVCHGLEGGRCDSHKSIRRSLLGGSRDLLWQALIAGHITPLIVSLAGLV